MTRYFNYDTMPQKVYALTGKMYYPGLAISTVDLINEYHATCVSLGHKIELCSDTAGTEIRNWCESQFGDNWLYKWNDYYFKHEKDANWFKLRWA